MAAPGGVVVVTTRSIAGTIDHVAIAVRSAEAALDRWAGELGGAQISGAARDGFHAAQLRYRRGTKLEIVSEVPGVGSFVGPFLARRGATVHHVTVKVPSLHDALEVLEAERVPVVDVDTSRAEWHEAFISPRVSGGPVVQVVATPYTDAQWSARQGRVARDPRPSDADFVGVVFDHVDLESAAWLWRVLGAKVTRPGPGWVRCSWGDDRLRVWLRASHRAAPVGLVFRDADPGLADPVTGPALFPDRRLASDVPV